MPSIILAVLIAGLGYIVLVSTRSIEDLLRQVLYDLGRILIGPVPATFTIYQGDHMPITGIQAGGQGTFTATPLPQGAMLPAGNIPAWSADQPDVTIQPASDGLSVVAGVPAAATYTTFNLTITAQPLPDGTQPTATVAVPVQQVVTGFEINQTA